MSAPIFVDSTVFTRLLLGGPGSDFAVNFFSRVESGVDYAVTDSLALLEALIKLSLAVASGYLGTDSYERIVVRLSEDQKLRSEVLDYVEKLVAYVDSLVVRGRMLVYAVGARELSEAVELARQFDLPLGDAVHYAVIRRLRIQKVATFSPWLRKLRDLHFIP